MSNNKRVIQLKLDVEVGEDISDNEMEMLYNTLKDNIDNFNDIDGNSQEMKFLGQFSIEDISQQYIDQLGWNSKRKIETYNVFDPSDFAISKLKGHGEIIEVDKDVVTWKPKKNVNCEKILTQLDKTKNILGFTKD